jgi:hypothetical protein
MAISLPLKPFLKVTDLAVNGKQTKEKKMVMAEFSKETTYDEENLLSMSKENIKVVLEKRANDKFVCH